MKSPAFQFYPTEYLGSQRVSLMSLEEEGGYIRLLSSCWIHGSIPSDPIMIARLIGKGASTTLATTLATMFTPHPDDGARLVHDRLERERSKQAQWRDKSREGGLKSAKLRESGKGGSTVVEVCLPNGINQKPTLQSLSPSLSLSSNNTDGASPKSQKQTVSKPDTVAEAVSFFLANGSSEDQAQFFFDHFTANGWKQGGKAPIKDWHAAARNWIRRGQQQGQTQAHTAQPAPKVRIPDNLRPDYTR